MSNTSTSADSRAVYNSSNKSIVINDGRILATNGYAVYNASSGSVGIDGGVLFAYGEDESDVIYGSHYTIGLDATIVAWDNAAGNTEYDVFSSEDIFVSAEATAVWDTRNGIVYANGATNGIILIEGVTVKKGIPTYTVPTDLTAIYGQTLANVLPLLTGGWEWMSPATLVGEVGEQTHKVKFTPDDVANYNIVENIDVKVVVSKANPAYTAPNGLTATYGQTLKDVTPALTDGWSWMNPTTSVGAAGEQTHKAKFTPSDVANYNVVENIDVKVMVGKATPAYTAPDGLTATVGQTLKDVLPMLTGGWSWMVPSTLVGAVGEQTHKAKFTPSDIANYNIVENIDVKVVVSAGGANAVLNKKESSGRSDIRLSSNIVSEKAVITVDLPNGERVSQIKAVIYDNIGNVVFEKTERDGSITWNLTNNAGRNVANGTYLIVVEAKNTNGKSYQYSTKVGVKR
ncbi:MAG: hypothetical protein LBH98_00010 [Chitinispirillales bacterium]|nr:hypothetical protein [Chitinispirillales bacterium]